MRTYAVISAFALGFFAVGCESAQAGEPACLAKVAQGLVSGTQTGALVNLDASELTGVMRLELVDRDASSRYCTGTLIGARTVLTAAHCATPSTTTVSIVSGDLSARVEVETVDLHPSLDLALLVLEEAEELAQITPIPLASQLAWSPRALVQLAGYGDLADAPRTSLTLAVEEVVEVDADSMTVSSFGFSGACQGDSGGPLLTRAQDGRTRVAAVLSGGDDDCHGQDRYVRLDAADTWLAERAPSAEAAALSCDHINAEGHCYGGLAVYCDDGALRALACSDSEVCGWSAAAHGYRCVAAGSAACGGVDEWGDCEQAVARRCDHGTLVTSTCDLCGGECVRSPKTGHATCYAGP